MFLLTIRDDDVRVLEDFLTRMEGCKLEETGLAESQEDRAGTKWERLSAKGRRAVERRLSDRELDVLERLVAGDRYAEIATRFCVSLATVKTHVHHIYQKLQVRNRAEAIVRYLA